MSKAIRCECGHRFIAATVPQHRLYCGDSSKEAAITGVMGTDKADMVVTSPPYNVGMKYATYKDKAIQTDYLVFIRAVAGLMLERLQQGGYLAWNMGVSPKTLHAHQVVEMINLGFTFQRQIVWVKTGVPYPIFSTTLKTRKARHYKPNYVHEVIAVMRKQGRLEPDRQVTCPLCEGEGKTELGVVCPNAFDVVTLMTKGPQPSAGGEIHPLRKYSNDVWKIAQCQATVDLETLGTKSTGLEHKGQKAHMVKEHPAAFPVEVPAALMCFLSCQGEIVLDPFAGSGTTLIAAEKLHRRSCSIEIDPRYCDVAVKRWEEYTGKKAKRAKR